jgi:hypothetical protein
VLANEQDGASVVAHLGLSEQVTETQGNMLRIPDTAQASVLARLVNANIPIVSLTPVNRTLEEVYVDTTESTTNI